MIEIAVGEGSMIKGSFSFPNVEIAYWRIRWNFFFFSSFPCHVISVKSSHGQGWSVDDRIPTTHGRQRDPEVDLDRVVCGWAKLLKSCPLPEKEMGNGNSFPGIVRCSEFRRKETMNKKIKRAVELHKRRNTRPEE